MKNKPFVFFIVLVFAFLAVFGLGWKTLAAPVQQDATPTEDAPNPRMAYDRFEGLPHFDTALAPERDVETLSPDIYVPWSQIVFESYRDSNWEIYLADGSGSNHARLTWDAQSDIHPRLNRGCTRIVFASNRTGSYELFAMNPDSSWLTQLTNNTTDDVNPSWSPDGTRIVFQAYRDGQAEIYSMNADGSGQTRLTWDADYDGMPSWSPDGSKIAFVSRRTGSYNVYVMNPDSSGLVKLSNQSYSQGPSWSPDGSKIAYAGDSTGDGWLELWTMNADGTNPYRLYTPGYYQDALPRSWSPDGQYIAFTQVHYIYDQGQWYWTNAYLNAGTTGGNNYLLSNSNTEWNPDWQSSDIAAPASTMATLPPESPYLFTVNWSGSDEGPSGLKNYDVQVREGIDGFWTDWQMATTATTASYTGVGGHTYYFRVRARDNIGNLEAWPEYDTFTTVENLAPISTVYSLSPTSRGVVIPVLWGGTDPGNSGIASYDVQYRDESNPTWINWEVNTPNTGGYFQGVPGHTYSFRVRATDRGLNVEDWHVSADTSTTLYKWAISGQISNNSGVPVSGTNIEINPEPFANILGRADGIFHAWVGTASTVYTATWSKSGYGELPSAYFDSFQDININVVLPPINNIVQNWGFEEGWTETNLWTRAGIITPVITSTLSHTGDSAALLGYQETQFAPPVYAGNGEHANAVLDKQNVLHMVWVDGSKNILYARRSLAGTWSTPEVVMEDPGNIAQIVLRIVTRPDGSIHIVWVNVYSIPSSYSLNHRWMNAGGSWSETQTLMSGYNFIEEQELWLISTPERLHLAWNPLSYPFAAYYTHLEESGSWVPLETITNNDQGLFQQMIVDARGVVHTAFAGLGSSVTYYHRHPDGVWSDPVQLSSPNAEGSLPALQLDSAGNVHAAWFQYSANPLYSGTFYAVLRNDGNWMAPVRVSTTIGSHIAIVARQNGSLQLFYVATELFSLQRTPDGSWLPAEVIGVGCFNGNVTAKEGQDGSLHVSWACRYGGGVYYKFQNPQGEWSPTHEVNLTSPASLRPIIMLFDTLGKVHLIGDGPAEISDLALTKDGASILKQSITLPISMTHPVLSFVYNIDEV